MTNIEHISNDTRTMVEEFRKRHRTALLTLLFTDLVGSTKLKQERGDSEAVAIMQAHAEIVREKLRAANDAQEISTAGDSFFCVFVKPSDAVAFALRAQAALREKLQGQATMRVGIHLGEVVVEERKDAAKPLDLFGLQVDSAARVMSLAEGGQILCTRAVFDNARQVLKGRDLEGLRPIAWLNHGPYVLKGVEDPVEICEVGEEEVGVLKAPGRSEKAHPAGMSEEELGWRPSHETKIPGTDWLLAEKLGEGGFGEVWLANHRHTKERRVFKFCFLKERARSLKRELALFRLIRERIGEHPGIVRLYEVHLEEPPYYLGIEHVKGHNLREWLKSENRLGRLPLTAKLDIAAQVAEALEAAHNSGVIHQDIKPENILVDETAQGLPSGAPRVKLSDFGVGRVVDQEILGKLTMTMGSVTLLAGTTRGSESGSLLYMAPERLEGKGATPQSDLYSLGVVLFQLMAGNLDRAVTPDWESEVPDAVIRADLHRALAGTPERRFASAAEFAERLRSWSQRKHSRMLKWVAAVIAIAGLSAGITYAIVSQQIAKQASLRKKAENTNVLLAEEKAKAISEKIRYHAESEYLKARGDKKSGNRMTALAHAMAFLRIMPDPYMAYYAWELRRESCGRLLWISPEGISDRPSVPGHVANVSHLAFSADGTRLTSGAVDGAVCVWDVATGREMSAHKGQGSKKAIPAFSPDGTCVAFAPDGEDPCVIETAAGREVYRLQGHEQGKGACAVAFTADGKRLASGGVDGTVRFWDMATGKEVLKIDVPHESVYCLAFSNDGKQIAFVPTDGTVRICETETGRQTHRLDVPWGMVTNLAFNSDGTRLAAGTYDIYVWDTATGQELRRFTGHTLTTLALAFSPGTDRIASGSCDGTVRIWSLISFTSEELRLEGHGGNVVSVAFSPDGRWLASGASDSHVRIWDTTERIPSFETQGEARGYGGDSLSSDGRMCASPGNDRCVHVYDGASGKEITSLKGHEAEVTSATFSPDCSMLVSTSKDKTIQVWDTASWKRLARLEGHSEAPPWVVFSADSRLVASAADDRTARVWNLASGKQQMCVECDVTMREAVIFSPDCTRLACGAKDETVKVWEVATGAQLTCLTGIADTPNHVVFSPDGKRLAVGDPDEKTTLWDASTGRKLGDLPAEDGLYLVTKWKLAMPGCYWKSDGARQGEPEYYAACCEQTKSKSPTLLPRLSAILDRWEREIGMRVNLETGEIESIPSPGTAYANDPKIAEMCK